jgi:biotin transport system substrate-specific component
MTQMHSTLANRLWPSASSSLVRNVGLAVAGSLLVAAAANVSVPMWPVPMTLQTLAVLLVGGAYGARLGAATLALYAVEGAIGLPFFAGGRSGIFDSKLDYLLPASSMGYVAGFILAAFLVGKLAQSGWITSTGRMVAAAVVGGVALYVPGLVWLAIWAAKTQGMDAGAAFSAALSWGLYPFMAGDLIKAVIAGIGLPIAWNGIARKS